MVIKIVNGPQRLFYRQQIKQQLSRSALAKHNRVKCNAQFQDDELPKEIQETSSDISLPGQRNKFIDSITNPDEFSIIESPETVQDFAQLQLDELRSSVEARRNKIFLLLEEIRRLRIQERIKSNKPSSSADASEALAAEQFSSAIPLLPPIKEDTLQQYRIIYMLLFVAIILFGGLVAPTLELRLGLGGQSYLQFIQQLHLPEQLAQVDPIVASLCGGAVGVLSTLLVVEQKNLDMQIAQRCVYCKGSGYLSCAACAGAVDTGEGNGGRCKSCAGSGKVMCTSCLCTGKRMATEHDPRIDPFDDFF